MLIKKVILSLTLLVSTWQSILPVTLTNPVLKNADIAGLFRTGLLDIIRIREDIKHLTNGKYTWRGAHINVQLKNNKTDSTELIEIYVKKVEALFGATYVVLNPDNPLAQI